MHFHLRVTPSFARAGMYCRVCLFVLLFALSIVVGTFSTSGIALAHSSTTLSHRVVSQTVRPMNVSCPTTSNTANQNHYAGYDSIVGVVPFRVGWQPTSGGGGYGYCHVKAGHPEMLDKIAYILEYGKVIATSSASITIRGTYLDYKPYQVYISTLTNETRDGQWKGIISAYPVTS